MTAPLSDRPLILVVDDALPVRLVMARSLTGAGYAVITAPDGQSASTLIEGLHTPPDLVITDLRMPRMRGEALAAWLGERYPRLPVIFASGFPQDYDVILPGPLLQKPFTPEALCNVVRRVLERASQTMSH
jgi:CheY-like chemotaxis protein